VIVVLQHDPSSRTRRPNHRLDNRRRISNVLQEKSRMNDVERAPFVVAERKIGGIADPEFHEIGLAGVTRLPFGFGHLRCISLDPDDRTSTASHLARHASAELSQTASDVKNPLPAVEAQLPQRRLVEQPVQDGKSFLLFRPRAVNVV
jgi:hypothetical protein